MIDLTRRNFLLGVASSGLLTLLPPALILAEVKKIAVEKPKLVTGFIRGVSVGEIIVETTPGPCDIFLDDFTLAAEAQTVDVTPIDSEYRHTQIAYIDWTVESWVRTEELNCVDRVMQLRLKTGLDHFYSGEFLITSHYTYFGEHSSELSKLHAQSFGLIR